VRIRPVEEADWPAVATLLREVVEDGETYDYPTDLDDGAVRPLWGETPPAVTVVAVDGSGALLGSAKAGPNRPGRGAHVATAAFDSRRHGRVGLHVMHRAL
jgi:hypothetical protein